MIKLTVKEVEIVKDWKYVFVSGFVCIMLLLLLAP